MHVKIKSYNLSIALIFWWVIFLSAGSAQPILDCDTRKIRTGIEKTICYNQRLSANNSVLRSLRIRLYTEVAKRLELERSQKADHCGERASCIEEAQLESIDIFRNNLLEPPKATPQASKLPDNTVITLSLFVFFISAFFYARKIYRDHRDYKQAIVDFRWRENLTPIEFEQHCADYLNFIGWSAKTTKASGDQGADVIAKINGKSVAIQCKKYGSPVGNAAVQEVHAAKKHYRTDHAAVVTNSRYTKAAQQLAQSTNVHLLHFTDLRRLAEIVGKSAAHEDSSSDNSREAAKVVVKCPDCQKQLRLPRGKTGTVQCPHCEQTFLAAT